MWIISIIPLILTGIAIQFMPDSVPMHYDMSGKIDRWGSKYENIIFPIFILLITLFWQIFILYYEKKALTASTDKERHGAASNAKMPYYCFNFNFHCFWNNAMFLFYLVRILKPRKIQLTLLSILLKFLVYYWVYFISFLEIICLKQRKTELLV